MASIDHLSSSPGIAQVTAEKGYRVLLKDKDLGGVSRGQSYIKDNLQVRFAFVSASMPVRI